MHFTKVLPKVTTLKEIKAFVRKTLLRSQKNTQNYRQDSLSVIGGQFLWSLNGKIPAGQRSVLTESYDF